MTEFGGLWKQQSNTAPTESVRVFRVFKWDTTWKKRRKQGLCREPENNQEQEAYQTKAHQRLQEPEHCSTDCKKQLALL